MGLAQGDAKETIANELGIGVASVYRVLKEARAINVSSSRLQRLIHRSAAGKVLIASSVLFAYIALHYKTVAPR
jgi:hypothetical protein